MSVFKRPPAVVELPEDEERVVEKTTFYVSVDHGVTETSKHGSDVNINIDKFSTAPLTKEEALELLARVRRRMVTQGFRDTPEGRAQAEQMVKDYLREIGKSNEGLVWRVGVGWVPRPPLS